MTNLNQDFNAGTEVKKINTKITSSKVVTKPVEEPVIEPAAEVMNEEYARPDVLLGSTYKIKTPLNNHAMYITINDTVLNQGTIHEERRPFEIFINSKNMDDFQWIVAITRVISAVFRKGGDCTFLVEELKAVFDPKGGYFKPGGKFMPSLVADIGDAIESHFKMIGLIKDPELDEHQKRFIEEKKAQLQAQSTPTSESNGFPPSAQMCRKCHNKSVVFTDGCETCLNCGQSKCG